MPREIFISHSAEDKILVGPFVDLLQTGMNISIENIFCSSIPSSGIPSGQDFVDYIKNKLKDARVVIPIITRKFFASQFCLCEMGATWISGKRFLPLLVPPLTYGDIKGVLLRTQVTYINEPDKLDSWVDDFCKAMGMEKLSFARWGEKRDEFLKDLSEIIPRLEAPSIVPQNQHQKVLDELDSYKEQLGEELKEKECLQEYISKLEGIKDQEEVVKVKKRYTSIEDTYKDLVEKAKEKLDPLPNIVVECLFKYLNKDPMHVSLEDQKEVFLAQDNDYIYINTDDYTCSLNTEDLTVNEAIEAVCNLGAFLSKANANFIDEKTKEYKLAPSLGNRRFWVQVLRQHF